MLKFLRQFTKSKVRKNFKKKSDECEKKILKMLKNQEKDWTKLERKERIRSSFISAIKLMIKVCMEDEKIKFSKKQIDKKANKIFLEFKAFIDIKYSL